MEAWRDRERCQHRHRARDRRSVVGSIGTQNSELNLVGGSGTTPHLTIESSGEVGIGTTNPGSKLEVYDGVIDIRDPDDYGALQLTRTGTFKPLYPTGTSIFKPVKVTKVPIAV